MTTVYLQSVGVAAPGLEGWIAAQPVLAGRSAYVAQALPAYQPTLLPRNERRRATPPVRLAFRTAEDALRDRHCDPAALATVFSSSDSDLQMVHKINHTLAQPARAVSPTDFHNSVHNAPAGYWSIAVGSRQPSSSVAAHDASFAAGLLEAAALVLGDGVDTLYAAYDTVTPFPLSEKRCIDAPFGVALVLTANADAHSIAALTLLPGSLPESTMQDADLEALRLANPAARALPLLQLLAGDGRGTVQVAAVRGSLGLQLSPP